MNNVDTGKIVLYTVDDIQRIFKIGKTKAYALMSANGFPSFKMNAKLYVRREHLDSWLEKRPGKSFLY